MLSNSNLPIEADWFRPVFPPGVDGQYVYDDPKIIAALARLVRRIDTKPGVQVAFFANAYAKEVQTLDLEVVLDRISSGEYAEQIQEVRRLFAAWKAVCPALDRKDSPQAKAYGGSQETTARLLRQRHSQQPH